LENLVMDEQIVVLQVQCLLIAIPPAYVPVCTCTIRPFSTAAIADDLSPTFRGSGPGSEMHSAF
jgi:hypothetical protein